MIKRLQIGWTVFWSIFIILIENIISKMLTILSFPRITHTVFVHLYGGCEEGSGTICFSNDNTD